MFACIAGSYTSPSSSAKFSHEQNRHLKDLHTMHGLVNLDRIKFFRSVHKSHETRNHELQIKKKTLYRNNVLANSFAGRVIDCFNNLDEKIVTVSSLILEWTLEWTTKVFHKSTPGGSEFPCSHTISISKAIWSYFASASQASLAAGLLSYWI